MKLIHSEIESALQQQPEANKKSNENWIKFWILLLLSHWKAGGFQLWEDRETGSKESSSALKSIPICRAESTHIQLTAQGSWNKAFRNGLNIVGTSMTNPVYSAGGTYLFLSSRKHS